MDKYIKVGLGILIRDGDKILLGHRAKNMKDTGGIYEPDTWTIPGGKQEYDETIFEGAIREVKEETNLCVEELDIFNVADDIQPDRHYITIQIIANKYNGELKVMEPDKQDEWKWFDINNLPEKIYSPSKKFIEEYKKRINNTL